MRSWGVQAVFEFGQGYKECEICGYRPQGDAWPGYHVFVHLILHHTMLYPKTTDKELLTNALQSPYQSCKVCSLCHNLNLAITTNKKQAAVNCIRPLRRHIIGLHVTERLLKAYGQDDRFNRANTYMLVRKRLDLQLFRPTFAIWPTKWHSNPLDFLPIRMQ